MCRENEGRIEHLSGEVAKLQHSLELAKKSRAALETDKKTLESANTRLEHEKAAVQQDYATQREAVKREVRACRVLPSVYFMYFFYKMRRTWRHHDD